MSRSKKSEVTIAVIGLVGVLVTAVLSNWGVIFHNEIRAGYAGYRATGDFETELRYYMDVSGTRKAIESTQQQLAVNYRMSLISEYPESAEAVDAVVDAVLEEAISVDEVIVALLPAYRNHFTIEELQELNRFYSTEVMQNMVRKLPLLAQEAAPVQAKLMQEYQNRLLARIEEIID